MDGSQEPAGAVSGDIEPAIDVPRGHDVEWDVMTAARPGSTNHPHAPPWPGTFGSWELL